MSGCMVAAPYLARWPMQLSWYTHKARAVMVSRSRSMYELWSYMELVASFLNHAHQQKDDGRIRGVVVVIYLI